jgi:integrase
LAVAADYYAAEVPFGLRQISVAEALQEMLEQKTKENVAKASLGRLKASVSRLGKAFPGCVGAISGADMLTYLERYTHPKTRNNNRGDITTFLLWCRSKQYLPAGKDVATHNVKCAKVRRGVPGIVTVDQMKNLLEAADYSMIPFIAICGFAGIRPAEAKRLEWQKDIFWEDRVIRISELVSKTRLQRLVPMTDNLVEWLQPFRSCQGVIAIWENTTQVMTRLAKTVGFPWIQNCLRHSYASYRYPVVKSLDQLADEMGNSVDKLNKNYVARGLSPIAVDAYWKILPSASLAKPLTPDLHERLPKARAQQTLVVRLELLRHAGKKPSEAEIQQLKK